MTLIIHHYCHALLLTDGKKERKGQFHKYAVQSPSKRGCHTLILPFFNKFHFNDDCSTQSPVKINPTAPAEAAAFKCEIKARKTQSYANPENNCPQSPSCQQRKQTNVERKINTRSFYSAAL